MYQKKSLNGDVIMVEDDHDVIHDNNSLDLTLSDSLNDLDFAALNIDSQSIKIKAPPDIIPVDDDDDFIHNTGDVPHDLEDFDDEVIANANDDDDDEDAIMSTVVARGHDGDGSGDDPSRPSSHPIGLGVGGRKATTRGKEVARMK
ncbi:hypothetical protein Tco_0881867 [Tanacetum coccineum]